MQWQPIETAPKDGTIVFVKAIYIFDQTENSKRCKCKWAIRSWQKVCKLGKARGAIDFFPTHWKPLSNA